MAAILGFFKPAKCHCANSLHKPPRLGGMRMEKVLPLPDDRGSLI